MTAFYSLQSGASERFVLCPPRLGAKKEPIADNPLRAILKNMLVRFIFCVALCLISGCAAERTVMINSRGEEAVCETAGSGFFGAISVNHQQQQCIADAEKRGYGVKK